MPKSVIDLIEWGKSIKRYTIHLATSQAKSEFSFSAVVNSMQSIHLAYFAFSSSLADGLSKSLAQVSELISFFGSADTVFHDPIADRNLFVLGVAEYLVEVPGEQRFIGESH